MITKLGIYGSPSFYGGADTELGDQMYVWNKMGIELHVVPATPHLNSTIESYIKSLAILHPCNDINTFKGMPVISFCCGAFLQQLAKIRKIASHIIWVNCMTYTFPAEEQAHINGWIDLHLYQTPHAEDKITSRLKSLRDTINTAQVIPYFNIRNFKYKKHNLDRFVFGRISRDDRNKYMPETLDIYNLISAPKEKEAVILGYTFAKQATTIGKIKETWIRAYRPLEISQQEFYRRCDVIVQTSTCYENWPRVGLEAMASGSVLVVYNNDGWRGQVVHGETGYLCNTPRDFIFYASHLAHHPELRKKMAESAYQRLQNIAGLSASIRSWESIFSRIN